MDNLISYQKVGKEWCVTGLNPPPDYGDIVTASSKSGNLKRVVILDMRTSRDPDRWLATYRDTIPDWNSRRRAQNFHRR